MCPTDRHRTSSFEPGTQPGLPPQTEINQHIPSHTSWGTHVLRFKDSHLCPSAMLQGHVSADPGSNLRHTACPLILITTAFFFFLKKSLLVKIPACWLWHSSCWDQDIVCRQDGKVATELFTGIPSICLLTGHRCLVFPPSSWVFTPS